jgi:hypothetical protein
LTSEENPVFVVVPTEGKNGTFRNLNE